MMGCRFAQNVALSARFADKGGFRLHPNVPVNVHRAPLLGGYRAPSATTTSIKAFRAGVLSARLSGADPPDRLLRRIAGLSRESALIIGQRAQEARPSPLGGERAHLTPPAVRGLRLGPD